MAMSTASNHPLSGMTGAFFGLMSFAIDFLTASALFYFLAGWFKLPPLSFLGLNYPWEMMFPFLALLYYWLSGFFSVNRARSRFWAAVDFIGASMILLVLIGAALSFHPMIGDLYREFGLPTVEYNTINMALLISFAVVVIVYYYKYHIERAEVGLDAVELSKTSPRWQIRADRDEVAAALEEGKQINFYDATVVIADPAQAGRFRVKPTVVGGTDTPAAS